MRPVDPLGPLFQSRLDAGEDLYFRSPLGRPEPGDACVLVASDGAVEVAWPWAYLCGLPVRRVDPGALPAALPDLGGRAVALVDDGLLAPDAVARVVGLARAAAPRCLLLVAPALPSSVRRACRGLGLDRIVTLEPSTLADTFARLYPQRPVQPGVARVLLAEVADGVRQDRGLPPMDSPDATSQRADRPPLHLVAK